MTDPHDVHALVAAMRAKAEPFAVATVVRTVALTAAKAGAKAIIRADGTITGGWIGGGCARGAVLRTARQVIADGEARLVSVQPEELLADLGVAPGDERDGVRFAANRCPSKGTMDVFVEAVLPRAQLVICGSTPVAEALCDLGRRMGYETVVHAPQGDLEAFGAADRAVPGWGIATEAAQTRFVVVATQGAGDAAALGAALASDAGYVAFVGSRLKAAALRAELIGAGLPEASFERLHAPAGLDIGAITPEEIALSILAEITVLRRRGQRGA
ncbi:XdhC family protein [Salinarimonas chemoclinalis]|uniref:XdhC family protein n=1 Tax=Salinarimonas chemoclinalis TaxID=3241599 RepID=UPI003556C81C